MTQLFSEYEFTTIIIIIIIVVSGFSLDWLGSVLDSKRDGCRS
jgi:hypothetical protein